MNKNLATAVLKVLLVCAVIFFVSAYFIYNLKIIGWVLLALGLLCLVALVVFKIRLKGVWPDVVFGVIDNGILAVLAVWGGEVAGVPGAIIGGAVGNALTDGIAGIFEGEMAEKLRERKISEGRTVLGSALGKMAGCLLGAGAVLAVAGLLWSASQENKMAAVPQPTDSAICAGAAAAKADSIRLTFPCPNATVQSPLLVTGEARGSWFFEGSFPVVLTDWDGLIIGQGQARAQGEWTTADFVPFTATIDFQTPQYKNNGTLILKKDNPSGLPPNDAALEVPVIFSR